MKKLLTLLLVMTMLLALSACKPKDPPAQTTVDRIKAAGKLVLGTSADYPPFEFHYMKDGADTITGVDIMIAEYIAKDLGVELEIVDMGFDGLLISLAEGKFDLVLAGMSPSEERKQGADFTISTINSNWIVIIRKSDDAIFNTTGDFADKKIGVQRESTYLSAAEQMTDPTNVVQLVKFADLIVELQNGTIDAIIANAMTSTAYASGNPDLISKDVGIVHNTLGQAAAVKKGDTAFVEYLNTVLEKIQQDGTLDQYIVDATALATAAEQQTQQ